jgi:hypothetical protein
MTNSLPFYPLILYTWLFIMGPLPLPTQTLTSDEIPPGPLSEDDLRQRWNKQADEYNQWESLDSCEQLEWAQALAIWADRHAAALKAKPTAQRPTDEDLYDLLGDAPRPTYLNAIRLAQGCHDYSGGHSGPEGEAWHGAIDTVVDVLKRAAVGPWDSQTRAVFGIGSEAQAVPVPVAWCRSDEFANSINRGGSFNGWMDPGAGANKCDMQLYAIPLPAPVPVTECPNCGYEGEMVPVTQAGKVKA